MVMCVDMTLVGSSRQGDRYYPLSGGGVGVSPGRQAAEWEYPLSGAGGGVERSTGRRRSGRIHWPEAERE